MANTFDTRTDFNGASRRRRSLEIPPPPGRRETVVVEALKTLAKKRKKFIGKVEDAIDENGITIEVTRLRDRLTRLALGDTERLLLSTPGVTEQLFYEAIEEELEEYDNDRVGDLFDEFLGELVRDRIGAGPGSDNPGGAGPGIALTAADTGTSTGAGADAGAAPHPKAPGRRKKAAGAAPSPPKAPGGGKKKEGTTR
jgi:hypothetical protein